MYKKLQIAISSIIVSTIWFNIYYQSKNNICENNKEMERYTEIVL